MRRPGPAAQERVQAGRVREQNGTAWRAQGQRGWAGQPLKKGQPHGDPGALGGGGPLCTGCWAGAARGRAPLPVGSDVPVCACVCEFAGPEMDPWGPSHVSLASRATGSEQSSCSLLPPGQARGLLVPGS